MVRAAETLDEAEHGTPPRDKARSEPHLFVVLECDRPRAGASRHSLAGIDQVTIGRGDEREAKRSDASLTLRVPGAFMSTIHARVVRRGEQFVLQDATSRNGTFHEGRRVTEMDLADGAVFECGRTLLLYRAAVAVPAGTPPDAHPVQGHDRAAAAEGARSQGLRTTLPALAERYAQLESIARSNLSLLLLGETGTGKEVIARAAHALSERSGAFVPVNCGAIPTSLVESQLFGHVKGAFSGATRDELGFVRAADRGTLFLDEIGDLPKASQATLLRVLQQREVTPIGSTRAIPVDIRVISATHQPLEDDAFASEFRRDLLARLAGYTFRLPPLRERIEDVGMLVAELLPQDKTQDERHDDRALAVETGRALLAYDWPLNVRELQQALASAALLAGGGRILHEHLPASIAGGGKKARPATPGFDGLKGNALRDALVGALTRHRGNVAAVAREANKAPIQIHRWMRRFSIDPASFRS